jgi:predicted ATPase/class 3 adenylate cyclase/Tfp pilus assembly protein PilF
LPAVPDSDRMARELPTGTVTFLFTDIESSTRLLQAHPDRYAELLEQHSRILRQAIASHGGVEVGTEGDSFFAVFPSAVEAIAAAAEAQNDLAAASWPEDATLHVRMGTHTGEGRLGGDSYVGIDVHRAARIAAAAHGGQVLLSHATQAVVRRALPEGTALVGLGRHRLKDLDDPEDLFQLAIEGMRAEFPPPRSVEARPTNLPTPATSFVGRHAEVAEVRRLLGESRLLTLTGPGGTGKTRLALEVARLTLADHADGAFFVSLDAVRDPGLVPSAVAAVLRVEERGRSTQDALGEHLAARDLLLVLDNFEQIVEAAPFVDGLLGVAPRLKVLITSRVPLRLYGEQEYAVDPLGLPAEDEAVGLGELKQYDAVTLFIERARAVRPDFSVTNENAPAVAEICVRLDGLPLAIELAAARVKVLSPEAILGRLGSRLDLLVTQAPNMAPRQRTLRAAIDWSYQLLSEPERALFERLSVFAGGWDLEAAESVGDPGALEIDILDGMASLVDKSLVRHTARMGEPRFRMLQTIQEYAWERLAASGGAQVVQKLHADYFATLLETAEPHLEGPSISQWLARLAHDHANMRAVIAWSLQIGYAVPAMRLMSAGWRFWQARGLLREARSWCEQILASPAAAGRTPERARMVAAAGGIAYWQGDVAAATGWYEEEQAIYEALGDERGIADALLNRAFTALTIGGPDASRALFLQALERFRTLGDERNVANVLGSLGYTLFLSGRPEEALPYIEQARASNEATGNLGRMHDNDFALGHVQRQLGDYAEAARQYRRSMLGTRQIGDASRGLMVIGAIAALVANTGWYAEAVRLTGAMDRTREEQGGGLSTTMYGGPDAMEQARERSGLDDEAMRALLQEGRAMDLEALTMRVLELLDEIEAEGRSASGRAGGAQ